MELISRLFGTSDSRLELIPIYTVTSSEFDWSNDSLPYSAEYGVYSQLDDLLNNPVDEFTIESVSVESLFKNLNVEETDCVLFDDFSHPVVERYSDTLQSELKEQSENEINELPAILSLSDSASDFQLLLPFENSAQHVVDSYMVPDSELPVQVVSSFC